MRQCEDGLSSSVDRSILGLPIFATLQCFIECESLAEISCEDLLHCSKVLRGVNTFL
jgi:hypothetical protein